MKPIETEFMEKMGVSEFGTPAEMWEEMLVEEILYDWDGGVLDGNE